jgi:hypothetical protein
LSGAKNPPYDGKKWLGHARLETTAIYLDVSGEEERKLAARLWEYPFDSKGILDLCATNWQNCDMSQVENTHSQRL